MQTNDTGSIGTYTRNPSYLNQYTAAPGGGVSNGSEHEIAGYQGVSYRYYGDRRLARVSGAGHDYGMYYDALGRCVRRDLDWTTTFYTYDGEKPIYEWQNGTRAGWNLYGKGIDEILLRADYVILTNGQGYFFQLATGRVRPIGGQDHEGSVTHLMSFEGTKIESYRYDAFGAPTTTYSGGSFNNRFKFTGREYAEAFGIYEYRNRAYHPGLGRFTNEDPKGFEAGDYNLFRYGGNDPVDRVDPMGLEDNVQPTAHGAGPQQQSNFIDLMEKAQQTSSAGEAAAHTVEQLAKGSNGRLAVDTDGSGRRHGDSKKRSNISGAVDGSGHIVPYYLDDGRKNPAAVRRLNADRDNFGVAPKNEAIVNEGHLRVGDRMQVTLENGTVIRTRVGDFGPNGGHGEVSIKALRDNGVKVIFLRDGPQPSLNGRTTPDISVVAQYFANTFGD